jgi:hypothetical protein
LSTLVSSRSARISCLDAALHRLAVTLALGELRQRVKPAVLPIADQRRRIGLPCSRFARRQTRRACMPLFGLCCRYRRFG